MKPNGSLLFPHRVSAGGPPPLSCRYQMKRSVPLILILGMDHLAAGPEAVVCGLLRLAAPAPKLCLWEAFYLKGS